MKLFLFNLTLVLAFCSPYVSHAQQSKENLDWLLHNDFYADMSWLPDASIKIDGKPSTYTDLQNIDFNEVIKIEVYKKKDAVKVFGKEQGRKGMVLITKRKKKQDTHNVYTIDDSVKYYTQAGDTIFLRTTQDAAFIGGNIAWQKYLERNLDSVVPVDAGSPAGIYKVTVEFLVNKDGTISDLKVVDDPGYNTAYEVMRIIKKIPQWQAGTYKGQQVKCLLTQSVTFFISNG